LIIRHSQGAFCRFTLKLLSKLSWGAKSTIDSHFVIAGTNKKGFAQAMIIIFINHLYAKLPGYFNVPVNTMNGYGSYSGPALF